MTAVRAGGKKTLEVMRKKLIEWGKRNFREFPWRFTTDPYRILVSEILLHRTRAEQVVPFYIKLIRRYPTVTSLARAKLSDLEALLHPLGLRWRIEKMLLMAREIVERYGGLVPDRKEDLLSLPGVSDYIAGIASVGGATIFVQLKLWYLSPSFSP